MEGDQRRQALDLVLAERADHPSRRVLAVDVPGDQLRDHRVVERGHLAAGLEAGVDADAGARGLEVGADLAGRRCELLVGGLGVDPALDRVAAHLHLVLGDRERLAGGDPDLLADDVDAGDHLGHAVLDLDAGVHLEEEVVVADLHALDGAGAAVVDRLGGVGGDLADPLAHLLVDVRRGRLLDQLLVAALDRAVALAEVDDVAVAVGEDLDLDVAGVLEVALEVDGVVAEELLALAGGALEGVGEVVGRQRDAEALAAAAAGGLAGDRVADLGGQLRGVLDGLGGLGGAGDDRHPGLLHDLAGPGLRAHRVDRVGRRADPGDVGLADRAGEGGVLGEEPVAGVDRLGAGLGGDREDLLDVQVALGRDGGTEQVGLVGLADVAGVAVGLGVDGDRADAHLLERADDADRDLAAVCDQDFLEHRRRRIVHPGGMPGSAFGLVSRPESRRSLEADGAAAADEGLHDLDDHAADRRRDQDLGPGRVAVVGIGGVLVGEGRPDPLEDLLAEDAGEQADDDGEWLVDELHRYSVQAASRTASCSSDTQITWSLPGPTPTIVIGTPTNSAMKSR